MPINKTMGQPSTNITSRSILANHGGRKKVHFWALLQQLLKTNENYTNDDTLHCKRIQFAQTCNTFQHRISNYQMSLLYTVGTTTMFIMNSHFPHCPSSILPSPTPDILMAVLHINIIIQNNNKSTISYLI